MEAYCEGLQLRAPEPEDLEFILDMENSEEMMPVGLATGPYSRYQIREYIANNQNDIYTDRQLRFIICHREDGAVGIADLFAFDPRARKVEVGIGIAAEKRRRGIAEWTLKMLDQYCFSFLNLHQIYAYVASDNVNCVNLFVKCGYENKGTLKDWVCAGKEYKDVYLFQKIG